MNILSLFNQTRETKSPAFVILLDPDKMENQDISALVEKYANSGVDIFFVGGSLLDGQEFNSKVKQIKSAAGSKPVVIFPGGVNQVSRHADALLYLSLVSGRNADYLIGNQVLAVPAIKRSNIETISTAYMLIESGQTTSVEFMSGTKPIPRNKTDIAIAHALASEYIGFKMIYLEAGSGASQSVPNEMIKGVSESTHLPLIVGGGIKSPEEAHKKITAGANIIVVGNHFEKNNNSGLIKEFSSAIHS